MKGIFVSVELLERAATSIEQRMCIQCEGVPCCMPESLNTLSDIRALLSAPSPANHVEDVRAMVAAPSPDGVDGLEVETFLHTLHMELGQTEQFCSKWKGDPFGVSGVDYSSTYSVTSEPLCRLSDAQAIIDGLRGEVADLRTMLATVSKAGIRVRTERDQQAQRIGELEGLLRDSAELIKHGVFEDGIYCCGSSVDSHGFGDGHSPVDALAYHAGQVCERIDAALSAGKDSDQ